MVDCVRMLLKTLAQIDEQIHTLEKGVSKRKADTELAIKNLNELRSFIYNYEEESK